MNVLCREALSFYLQDAWVELIGVSSGPKIGIYIPGAAQLYDHAGFQIFPKKKLSHYAHLIFFETCVIFKFSTLFIDFHFFIYLLHSVTEPFASPGPLRVQRIDERKKNL